MVTRRFLVAVLLFVSLPSFAESTGKMTIVDRRTAADGVTKGWLEEIPWPDQSDASQAWRKLAVRLVITRHGRVVRKISAAQTFWSWNFWRGGREVVYQEGPVHGASEFIRADVASGKVLEEWKGSDEENPPAWVKAADPH